jgi:tetratricopeptide repeat protein 30
MGGRPQTTSGGGTTLGRIQTQIQEGNFTSVIYGHIRDHQYDEAVELLTAQLEEFPRSRAAMSLMAYCYYHMGDFHSCARLYEQLTKICPGVEEYRVYYAQSLYKAGLYQDAFKVCSLIDSEQHANRIVKLQACISYEQEELPQTKACLEKSHADDPEVIVLQGCVLYKEGNYEGALQKFMSAANALGFKPDLTYNMALCHYRMQQYGPSLKAIAEIIERGIEEHPELNIGSNTEGNEARSVGNTQVLRETALVEAFNLKAAIEYMMKNYGAAKEALTDMPPRLQEELDPVTLHNTALVNMAEDPTNGFKKFNYLLQHPPFPPETFQNLLLFYCRYQYYDLAADVLAENAHLSWKYLSQRNQPLYDFLDGLITAQTAPAEAYRKFDILAQKHIDQLRKLTKRIQDAKQNHDKEGVKMALKAYDEALEEYIPVLMTQANIYWDIENYPAVEKLFRQSAEFCSEHETWKLNVAHVFFMQENKFREAIRYYEPVVEANSENILNCSAIVLANLCVAYIMTSLNDKAEEVMRKIEKEEEKLTFADPEKQPLHLCIVNLVIGTLYCAKGNFEFGISRIIKSLEPYHRKIMTDTWYYAKRCFLALSMSLAKHMVLLKDSTFTEMLAFFDQADHHGAKIPALIHPDPSKQDHSSKNTVRYEARQLKNLYLKLRD